MGLGEANLLFQRVALLNGVEFLEKLGQTNVLVFGLGGVGSWCAEALVRSGLGKIGIIDYDSVCESNINRQIQATSLTICRNKAEALMQRLLEINPKCEIKAWAEAFSKENSACFGIEEVDYVIDAIDSIDAKLDLIEACFKAGVKLFSSMGMARKMDPTRIKTAGIWETQNCPLAKVVRQGLKKRGFSGNFMTVYSDEPSIKQSAAEQRINGSIVTVTASAGMALASLVLREIKET